MKRYLLDTNICIYIINRKPAGVFKKFRELQPDQLGISVMTRAELDFGVAESGSPRNRAALDKFLLPLTVYPFDDAASLQYGALRMHLESLGTPIGSMDLLIAAHALALDVVVVTNNTKEFDRVPGLRVENWVAPA